MYMEISPTDSLVLITSHLGKSIKWNISNFSRTKMVMNKMRFDDINNFFLTLSDHQQQSIFDTLCEIKETFNDAHTLSNTQKTLTEQVTRLYAFFPLDELRRYIALQAKIIYPPDLKENYSVADVNPARTYLKHEYKGLVMLVIALRIMIPIWGEYLSVNIKRVGSAFKEHLAVKLLTRTELMTSPEMVRLVNYLEATNFKKQDRDNAILRGISNDELPDYILSGLLVRGLAIGEVNASEEGGSIITNIFARLRHAINDLSRRSVQVQEKFRIDDKEGEDNSSKLEQYKNVQSVSIGDIEIHKYFITRSQDLALSVDKTLDLDKLKSSLELVSRMGAFVFELHNVLLVQWVLSRKVPARVIHELTASDMLSAMAVTQALLWHWGLLDLALIVTSSRGQLSEFSPPKKQAKKTTTQILNTIYPYQTKTTSKSNTKNVAHRAADDYEKSIRGFWLLANVPKGLEEYHQSLLQGDRWMCPHDLLPQLTDLIVHVHQTMKEQENESTTTNHTAINTDI